jgi:hypothetical protein
MSRTRTDLDERVREARVAHDLEAWEQGQFYLDPRHPLSRAWINALHERLVARCAR